MCNLKSILMFIQTTPFKLSLYLSLFVFRPKLLCIRSPFKLHQTRKIKVYGDKKPSVATKD